VAGRLAPFFPREAVAVREDGFLLAVEVLAGFFLAVALELFGAVFEPFGAALVSDCCAPAIPSHNIATAAATLKMVLMYPNILTAIQTQKRRPEVRPP